MIKNYIRTAWRSLWKNRATSMINIAGLSIGMTASVLILIWVQNEMHFDNYHKDGDRIYRLTTKLPTMNWIWESTPLLFADAITKELPDVELTTRMSSDNQAVFTVKGKSFNQKNCAYVDSNWFDMFNCKFIQGSAELFKQDAYGVILSESASVKYFGIEQAFGGIVQIEGKNYIVKGIVKDPPANSSFQFNAFLSLSTLLQDPDRLKNDEDWGNYNYITFVKISPKANIIAVTKKLTEILISKHNDGDVKVEMIGLKAMHFETDLQNSMFLHGNPKTVYIFSSLAFLLLLVACINYVNLTTAKSSLRAKEVSIRKIVGAARAQLFYQFVTEAILVSLICLATTLLLIRIVLPSFNAFTEKNFQFVIASPEMWKVLLLTLLTSLLLTSVYPALLLSSFKPLNIFRGINILKVKDGYFRKTLVIVQFTISVFLITGTLIIYRQMKFIKNTNPGYDKSQVISVMLPPVAGKTDRISFIQTLKQDLLAQSGIESASPANQSIVEIGSMCSGCADWDGRDTSFQPKLSQLAVDPDYQKTLKLQMISGRWFSKDHPTDKHGFILNETSVKLMNLHLPAVGQRFVFKGDTGRVLGIVKDFHFKSLHDKIGPVVIFQAPAWANRMEIRSSAKQVTTAIESVKKTWARLLPGVPLEYNFMDEDFDAMYKDDQRSSTLILVFALIAVFISAMGLFGLAAFAAEQRTKEIGIRKVLGASVSSISGLLSKEFIALVAVSMIIAFPIARWAFSQWMENFAYRTEISWWIYALAGLLALLIALGTVSFQAIKAAMANPVNSLRSQ